MDEQSTIQSTESEILDPITVTLENQAQFTYEAGNFINLIEGATTRKPEGFKHNISQIACASGNHAEAIAAFLELPFASVSNMVATRYSFSREPSESNGSVSRPRSENSGSGGPK